MMSDGTMSSDRIVRRPEALVSRERRARAKGISGPTVTVCRGCCCGTDRKHPDVDHAVLLNTLVSGIGTSGQVRVSTCLDACEWSNVVVVGPAPEHRRAGAKAVWLADMLTGDAIADVVDWVQRGGPGVEDAPRNLDLSTFSPTRSQRRAADEQR